MSKFILFLVQVNVTSIEIEVGVLVIDGYCCIIVLLCLFKLTNVIESQSTIVIMEAMWFVLDGFFKLS